MVHRATSDLNDNGLAKVLDLFGRRNLALNGGNCVFATSVSEFVGFWLATDGLIPL